ncbi:MAG TPA: hypothetical protein VER96_17915 [Polyangiaceae bacterium]|nr:hypothetical protein [Polyangiaceae bacterium]
MVLVIAIVALIIFVAANVLAVATLLDTSWRTTSTSIVRRRRLCRAALYAVPAAAIGKYLALAALAPDSSSSFVATLVSLAVACFFPLLANTKSKQALEAFEIRELIAGND